MASLKFSPEIDRQWPSPACCVRAQSSLFITTVQIRAFFPSLLSLSFFAVVFVRLSVIGRGQNIAKEWCPLHSPKGLLFRHIHRSGHSKKKKMAHRMFILENELGLPFQSFHYDIFFKFPEEIVEERGG